MTLRAAVADLVSAEQLSAGTVVGTAVLQGEQEVDGCLTTSC
jgi:hypothetical protein